MIGTRKNNQFVLEPRFTKDSGIGDWGFNQTKVQVTAVESICDTGELSLVMRISTLGCRF